MLPSVCSSLVTLRIFTSVPESGGIALGDADARAPSRDTLRDPQTACPRSSSDATQTRTGRCRQLRRAEVFVPPWVRLARSRRMCLPACHGGGAAHAPAFAYAVRMERAAFTAGCRTAEAGD
jgi:hypothetical protein